MATPLNELKELGTELKESIDAWKSIDEQRARELEALHGRVDELDVRQQKPRDDRVTPASKATGPFLGLETKAAPRLVPGSALGGLNYNPAKVRVGALVAATAFGEKFRPQLTDDEQKAVLEMSGPGGGYVIPEAIASIFIDAVRPATRVLQAGAVTYPMSAPIEHIPGWDEPIKAGWRGEGGAWFVDDDQHFRRVTLQAKTVSTAIDIGVEMIEDSGQNAGSLSQRIEVEMGKALAQALDLAALHGAGSDNEPTGLYTLSEAAEIGINTVALGSGNGATPADYDYLLDAIYEIEADNFEPSGLIWSPRTANTMRKITTGINGPDKTKLQAPDEVKALGRYVTNQVRNDLTVGSSNTCSAAFVGDFNRLVIGVRPSMGIRTITDPYTQRGTGMIRIWAWLRADVAVLNGPAFCVVSGIKAS